MFVPRVVVSMAWELGIKDDQRWSESGRIVWAICLRTESMLFAILCSYKQMAKCFMEIKKIDAAVFFGEGEVFRHDDEQLIWIKPLAYFIHDNLAPKWCGIALT